MSTAKKRPKTGVPRPTAAWGSNDFFRQEGLCDGVFQQAGLRGYYILFFASSYVASGVNSIPHKKSLFFINTLNAQLDEQFTIG